MDEKLVEALAEFRRAYSQWEDRAGSRSVAPSQNEATRELLFRLGDRMRDAMVAIDNLMTAGQPHPYVWPVHPADVHDGLGHHRRAALIRAIDRAMTAVDRS